MESEALWENFDAKEFELTFYDGDEQIRVTEPGYWYLTIPEGYFEDPDGNKNPRLQVYYEIAADVKPDIKWTADPENGGKAELNEGYQHLVTFTFEGADEVSYDPIDEMAGIRVLYNGENLSPVSVTYGDNAEYGYQLRNNWGDNTAIIGLSAAVMQKPGVVNISIDEGRFTIDGDPSPAIEYSCTFGEVKEYNYTLTPDGSEEVSSLEEFTLDFPDAKTAEIDEDNLWITLSQGQSWMYPGYPEVTKVEGAEHPTFKITFDFNEDVLKSFKNGNYSLMIDEGSFILDGNQMSPIIRQTYSYKSNKPVDWTIVKSPDSDEVLINYIEWEEYYLVEVGLAFPEYESVSVGRDIILELNGKPLASSYAIGSGYYQAGFSSDSNVQYYDIRDREAFTGTIKLTIPAGVLRLSGETNKEDLVYTWEIVAPKSYTYLLSPDGKTPVDSLDEIVVSFPEAKTGEVFNQGFIYMKDNDYNWLHLASVELVADAECPSFKMIFDTKDIKDGNVYNLQIREGCFTLDGSQESPEVEQAYTYDKKSGMALIPADVDGMYNVMTLDGMTLLEKAPASALLQLNKGIYIINGKKIIVK